MTDNPDETSDSESQQDSGQPDEAAPTPDAPAGPSQFVVPDPNSPTDGEATGAIPPVPPPVPPTAQAPPVQQPPPPMPPPGQAPPAAYPAAGAAAAVAPGSQNWQMPTSPPPPGSQIPPGGPPPAVPPEQKSGGSKAWLWILGGLVVLVGAIVGFVLVTSLFGGNNPEGTVDTCTITADGTLVAGGTVNNASEGDLTVRFDDADSGVEVDRVDVQLDTDTDASQDWSVEGSAGDQVQRVTCVLGPA